MIHRPVLLQEVIQGLEPNLGEVAIDATCGLGGHALALSQEIGSTGSLLAIDQDQEALDFAAEVLVDSPAKVTFKLGNFRNLKTLASQAGISSADMVLMDLGMSSWQLDRSGRGFSFQRDEPLLMSMETDPGDLTAKTIINQWPEPDLAQLFFRLGEEPAGRKIARAIVLARAKERINTTGQLVEVISLVKTGRPGKRINPATKVFQALRLAVNDELPALTEGLEEAWEILAPEGRLAVIAFHSLEARIVKRFFKQQVDQGVGELKNKKAIKPTSEEILENKRARSATLRVIRKLK